MTARKKSPRERDNAIYSTPIPAGDADRRLAAIIRRHGGRPSNTTSTAGKTVLPAPPSGTAKANSTYSPTPPTPQTHPRRTSHDHHH